ncbi:hypothetical protein HPB49_002740 [Dermacentor silvarum]|uniref:Uncharacterized protein n=1 Tax=Dermacentor silvarum TaxID=543639 RepID=A0ACB8CD81_DERSI|nr:hypothetical protein HPB49_002740 [Dermacentor silvarum]
MSATERTFALTVLPECDTTPAPEDEFVVIQMGALNLLIRDAFRPICRRPSLAVDRDIRLRLEAKMVLKYSCSAISSQWSSQRKQGARVFDVNLRSMQAIRSIGKGPTPLNDFWAVMNVSHRGLHQKTYQEHLKALKPADEVAAQTVFADAVMAVKDVYKEMKMNSTKNITVVYDGTLAKSLKGGNVSPGLLKSLLSEEQLLPENEDTALDDTTLPAEAAEVAVDHVDYVEQHSDARLVYYIAGYVARKRILLNDCNACRDSCLVTREICDAPTNNSRVCNQGKKPLARRPAEHADEGWGSVSTTPSTDRERFAESPETTDRELASRPAEFRQTAAATAALH